MDRLARIALAVAWLAAALPLAAMPTAPAPWAALVEPRAGQTLVAGGTAVLEWTPGATEAQGDEWTEEWEAFLSVDGGSRYTLRITPHLDRDLRRVTFRVPDLPTGDARILLRVGDERREIAVELPQRFAIVRPPGTERGFALSDQSAVRRFRPGEPARPGEPGVSRWIEGSRRGADMREVESAPPPGAEGVADPREEQRSADALAPEPAPDTLPARAAASRSTNPPPQRAVRRDPTLGAPLAADILLRTRRRNE